MNNTNVTEKSQMDDKGQQSMTNEDHDVAAACAQLQKELDILMSGKDGLTAVQSLNTAVASLREVEDKNVSSVQLVAL